jgi:hypothetical protein
MLTETAAPTLGTLHHLSLLEGPVPSLAVGQGLQPSLSKECPRIHAVTSTDRELQRSVCKLSQLHQGLRFSRR